MKDWILLILIVTLLAWAALYGFDKTVENRCAYYLKLGITDQQLCGTLNGKSK